MASAITPSAVSVESSCPPLLRLVVDGDAVRFDALPSTDPLSGALTFRCADGALVVHLQDLGEGMAGIPLLCDLVATCGDTVTPVDLQDLDIPLAVLQRVLEFAMLSRLRGASPSLECFDPAVLQLLCPWQWEFVSALDDAGRAALMRAADAFQLQVLYDLTRATLDDRTEVRGPEAVTPWQSLLDLPEEATASVDAAVEFATAAVAQLFSGGTLSPSEDVFMCLLMQKVATINDESNAAPLHRLACGLLKALAENCLKHLAPNEVAAGLERYGRLAHQLAGWFHYLEIYHKELDKLQRVARRAAQRALLGIGETAAALEARLRGLVEAQQLPYAAWLLHNGDEGPEKIPDPTAAFTHDVIVYFPDEPDRAKRAFRLTPEVCRLIPPLQRAVAHAPGHNPVLIGIWDSCISNVFCYIVEFYEHHAVNPMEPIERPLRRRLTDMISDWDKAFLYRDLIKGGREEDHKVLIDVTAAAAALETRALVGFTCAAMADLMKRRTAEQIMALFNIENN